jgi:D-alanyl-D-alanine carboxypeptidase
MHAVVTGRISEAHPGLVLRRTPPHPRLFAAALMTGALREAGVEVTGAPAIVPGDMRSAPVAGRGAGPLFAATSGAGITSSDGAPPGPAAPTAASTRAAVVEAPPPEPPRVALAVHESEPLAAIVRHINKASDNEYAERLLSVVGAELYGGEATNAKGITALRAAMTEVGLAPEAYRPSNGSGLGHANRISADGMADLLRRLYLDPRIGPEIVQSLSVGGVDGTTRNRFRGSPAAERVRAKTGTLRGKSALSGFVGDGGDVLVFSILVEGLRGRRLGTTAVRAAQVAAVNAMMRYARGAEGELPGDDLAPAVDLEAGDESLDADEDEPAGDDPAQPGAPGGPPPERRGDADAEDEPL